MTAYIQTSPATLKFDVTYANYNCFGNDNLGSLQMLYSPSCSHTIGVWSHQYLAIPYAPNPDRGIDASWYGTVPTDTALGVRLESYFSDGTLSQMTGYVYGGGLKNTGVTARGDGALLMNVQMQQTGGTAGSRLTPTVSWVAGNVYSS